MAAPNNRPRTWQPQTKTCWERLRLDPAFFLATWLYQKRSALLSALPTPMTPGRPSPTSHGRPHHTLVKVVCISDTHNTQPSDIPHGDLLLHAGDFTQKGSFEEIQAQLDWLKTLPHRHKIVIAGNHDLLLDPAFVERHPDRIFEEPGISSRADLDWGDITYLCNTSVSLNLPGSGRTLNIYGSPLTPSCGTFAFQYPDIRPVWPDSVPRGTDILLTHGPPRGHLDDGGKGCPQLSREIRRARPRLVVFGHIHPGHGTERIGFSKWGFDASYDGVVVGDKGLGVLPWMAASLLCEVLASVGSAAWGQIVSWRGQSRHQTTRDRPDLVNRGDAPSSPLPLLSSGVSLAAGRGGSDGAIFVNAAVIRGRDSEIQQDPIVVFM